MNIAFPYLESLRTKGFPRKLTESAPLGTQTSNQSCRSPFWTNLRSQYERACGGPVLYVSRTIDSGFNEFYYKLI